MKYYIAYGSNLNVGQMAYRCPGAMPVGTAYLYNHRLSFKGSKSGNYLTIEKAKGHCVPVAIWKVDDRNEKALDRYEGYPSFYYKKNIKNLKVKLLSGREVKLDCFVYIMREDATYGMPTGTYYLICSAGYRSFEFDDKFIEEALKYTQNMSKKQVAV